MRHVAAFGVEVAEGREDVGRQDERAERCADRAPPHEIRALDEESEAARLGVRVPGGDLTHVKPVAAGFEKLLATRAARRHDEVGEPRSRRAAKVAAARVAVRGAPGRPSVRDLAVHAAVRQEGDGARGRALVVGEIVARKVAAGRVRGDEDARRRDRGARHAREDGAPLAASRLEGMTDRLVPEHGRRAGGKHDVYRPLGGPMRGHRSRRLGEGARESVESRRPRSGRLERERPRRVRPPEETRRLEAPNGSARHELLRRDDRARDRDAGDAEDERDPARIGEGPVKRGSELGRSLFLVAHRHLGLGALSLQAAGLEEGRSAAAAGGLSHGLAERLGTVSAPRDEKGLAAPSEPHGGAALLREGGREEAGLGRRPRDASPAFPECLATLAAAQQAGHDPDGVLGVLVEGLDDVTQWEDCRSAPESPRRLAVPGLRYPLGSMALSDARLLAQAAFVARRLVAEGLVKGASTADVRHALEAALTEDRDRERALDEEVKRLLEKNAAAIRGADVDYAEMFRKAKRMLAEKKKIPL